MQRVRLSCVKRSAAREALVSSSKRGCLNDVAIRTIVYLVLWTSQNGNAAKFPVAVYETRPDMWTRPAPTLASLRDATLTHVGDTGPNAK